MMPLLCATITTKGLTSKYHDHQALSGLGLDYLPRKHRVTPLVRKAGAREVILFAGKQNPGKD